MITFYRDKGRHFPWRQGRTPYRVFLSEVLLQRTRAEQVLPIYNALIAHFPDLPSLNQGFPEAVEMVKSLGRESRFVHVKNGLNYILDMLGGTFPLSREELIKIPSIGSYTAAALRVFAFGLRDTIVDCNIVRVISRVHGFGSGPETRRSKAFLDLAEKAVPAVEYVEYSYGLLDFASMVCLPVKPLCCSCDLRSDCAHFSDKSKLVLEPDFSELTTKRVTAPF